VQKLSRKKDLKVDRSAFDRIISSGGFVSVNTGQAPDATAIPVTHQTAEEAFDSAACIGCGACVATCKNGSAALFTSAKITHMALFLRVKKKEANVFWIWFPKWIPNYSGTAPIRKPVKWNAHREFPS
jgi:succinate dehydrogenase/fumarate reductase-like Fe-S protein